MMIASYNFKQIGDVLIAVLGQDKGIQTSKKNGNIVALKNEDGKIIGYNIFNVSSITPEIKNQNGQVILSDKGNRETEQIINIGKVIIFWNRDGRMFYVKDYR